MEAPRGRIFNEASFDVAELTGRFVTRLISYCDCPSARHAADIVLLNVCGSHAWHRFFLDAGIGFYEEWTEEDAFNDYDDLEARNLVSEWSLADAEIIRIRCIGDFASSKTSHFEWLLSTGTLTLKYVNENDMESETVLAFTPNLAARMGIVTPNSDF